MSSMTKEELKNALISHGAPVPPASAKKDEFIQVIGAAYEFKIEFEYLTRNPVSSISTLFLGNNLN